MSQTWKKTSLTFLALLLAFSFLLAAAAQTAHAAGELTLYTRNKSITVAPGESISYSIDVINNTASIQNARLYVQGLPEGWEYDLTSGAYQINELSVKGEESQSVNLNVDVPLQVEKGEYSFSVIAEGITALPLTIVVSETGTFKTELTTKQPNMQGDADASFSFQLDLNNRTAEEQTYALTADVEQGWKVTFRVSGNNVTSATVEADSSQTVYVDIDPPENVSAGTYQIPVRAQSGATMAETTLEVVITGTYGIELTTPKGLLSAELTAGKSTKVELVVKNTGSAPLENVTLDYNGPIGWDVEFDQKTIDVIEPGQDATVIATITSSDKAIPGDYVTSITASTPEVSSTANFRIAVKTSTLWGWIGILIVLAVIAGIYYLVRKYGRR